MENVLKAIVVEDEPRSLEVLKNLLREHCPNVEVVATANTALKATHIIEAVTYDLIFLDINLGQSNVFDVLDKTDSNARIIFTTGDESYALKAFRYNAIDYLLKPIDSDLLIEAVKKVAKQIINKEPVIKDTKYPHPNSIATRISIPGLYGYELLDVEDILYCEAEGSYTTVHTRDGDKKMVSKTLGYFEEVLCSGTFFTRIHKKHIVNLKQITAFTRDKAPEVTLSNNVKLTVSSRSRADFFERLKEYAII